MATNRLALYVAENPLPPKRRDPRPGDLVYAAALWRASKATWHPPSLDSTPPLTGGRFTVIWLPRWELSDALHDVEEHNASAFATATKLGRGVKSWMVPVRMVYDRDETARIVDATGKEVQHDR